MKISIIVPVYNVRDYLRKCIDSLVGQTYRDFEVILVDDGSTDDSGAICDEYSRKYDFIRTFHKLNGGLSSARNYGLKFITGDYVSYVDSDDYVESDYLETLIGLTSNGEHEVASVAHCDELMDDPVDCPEIKQEEKLILSAQDALKALCYETALSTSACAKLFSSRLVTEYLFPEGKIYEDLFTIYKIIGASKSVVITNQIKYHYIQRKGSIRKSQWSTRIFDVWEATHNFIDYIKLYYPKLQDDSLNRLFISANEIYIRAFGEKDYKNIIKPIREELSKFYLLLKKNKNLSWSKRIQYRIMLRYPSIYRLIWKTYHL